MNNSGLLLWYFQWIRLVVVVVGIELTHIVVALSRTIGRTMPNIVSFCECWCYSYSQ